MPLVEIIRKDEGSKDPTHLFWMHSCVWFLGSAFQKSPCYTPWAESYLLSAYTWCEKESIIPTVYNPGCDHQRHSNWSECERVGPRDTRRQGDLGKVRPSYQQSWKRWVHKCSPAGLTVMSYKSFHSLLKTTQSGRHRRCDLIELPSSLSPCAVIKYLLNCKGK